MMELRVKNSPLVIRETEVTDAASMFNLINSDRAYLRQYKEWVDNLQSVDQERAYIDYMLAQENEHLFSLVLAGQLIGSINLHNFQADEGSVEMGYWLHSAHQHQGYMTQAVDILSAQAFQNQQLNSLNLLIAQDNGASQRVAKRAGYQLVGLSQQHVYYHGGKQAALLWCRKRDQGGKDEGFYGFGR